MPRPTARSLSYRRRAAIAAIADLAAAWVKLRLRRSAERRVAIVLANYPNRDGRIANGVGLDTPASLVAILDGAAPAPDTEVDDATGAIAQE